MSRNSSELDRILGEQLAIAAYVMEYPEQQGARLGLSDWVAEECSVQGWYAENVKT